MALRSGRVERRTQLVVPVRISRAEDPSVAERATTENICSLGIRVLVRNASEPNDLLLINTPEGDMRALGRVVYCQRLSGGWFAVGLQFRQNTARSLTKSQSSRA
jgi:hypothetical protein